MLHESNTFSTVPTDIDAFKRTQYLSGNELTYYHSGKRTEIGGMLDVLNEKEVNVVPSLSAWAMPSGIITRDAYDNIKNTFITDIRSNLDKLDGILFAFHGSMIVEGLEDPEGDVLQTVREMIPASICLGVSLDMHAHLTQTMVENADFFTAYRTHPHVDQFETGQRAAETMLCFMKNNFKPAKSYILLPMITQGENRDEPRERLMDELKAIDQDDKVIASLVTISHPWSDISIQGNGVLVITNDDQKLADRYAKNLARLFWDLRFDFPLDLYSIHQAVKIGLESKAGGPVVICEMGECLLGGASGDLMTSVSYLLQRGARDVVVAVVVDPESVQRCVESGEGSIVRLNIGGKLFREGNPPLPFEGRVKFIGEDIEGEDKEILIGWETRMGKMVVIEGHGMEIVLVENPGKTGGPSFLRALGINPEDKRFIVLKDSIGPLISYKDVASRVLLIHTPGWCDHMLATLNFTKVPRPLFPLDPAMKWSID